MRVALVVLQLRLSPGATEEGIREGAERAFKLGSNCNWPSGCAFYFIGSYTGRASKVKRVRFVDIPEDS